MNQKKNDNPYIEVAREVQRLSMALGAVMASIHRNQDVLLNHEVIRLLSALYSQQLTLASISHDLTLSLKNVQTNPGNRIN